ncbi:hypothetical protein J4457_01330 [Candidatus Woesearchaeota archaeon]|nr:hypothetical protein [Candidatus Woesearchaeota archaeon]
MGGKKQYTLTFLFILVLLPSVAAIKEGDITLLAVSQYPDGTEAGDVANLHLEVRQGQGRVFLDTFPLTKVGTQISMRFAQQIACKYLDMNCNKYDFIYTMKANSGIVAGPSAGAAATVLTIAVLEGKELNKHIAMTGTINSGNFIGPVGSIKEKMDAAKQAGMTTVLIPMGDRYFDQGAKEANQTGLRDAAVVSIVENKERLLDLVQYGKQLQMDVLEVADVEQALWYFLGEKPKKVKKELEIDPSYSEVMQKLTKKLCDRTQKLVSDIAEQREDTNWDDAMQNSEQDIVRLLKSSERLYGEEHYYSAASFCFRANVAAATLLYKMQRPSPEQAIEKINTVQSSLIEIEKKIDAKKIETINDLQTFMIVKERLEEADGYMNLTWENLNNTDALATLLAYAGERLYSAVSWSEFFNGESTKFNMDNEQLSESCKQKLSEVEERYNYANEYLPGQLEEIRKSLETAFQDYQQGNMALCLYRASKTVAEVNVILNLIGVRDDQVDAILQQKLRIAKKTIIDQQEHGIFPILGYSYYEYSSSLLEEDKGSSLLFAEYSLELSNLDIYFEKKKLLSFSLDTEKVWPFLLGLGIGILVTCYLLKSKKQTSEE